MFSIYQYDNVDSLPDYLTLKFNIVKNNKLSIVTLQNYTEYAAIERLSISRVIFTYHKHTTP